MCVSYSLIVMNVSMTVLRRRYCFLKPAHSNYMDRKNSLLLFRKQYVLKLSYTARLMLIGFLMARWFAAYCNTKTLCLGGISTSNLDSSGTESSASPFPPLHTHRHTDTHTQIHSLTSPISIIF